MPEPRLIIVTNREPFQKNSPSGVVSALMPVMCKNGGLWISGSADSSLSHEPNLPFDWKPVRYSKAREKGFYNNFSNSTLWPTYHEMLEFSKPPTSKDWASYQAVNEAFAKTTAKYCKPGDFVWVHDYQLSLVPTMLRQRLGRQNIKIGFFLHIPFPSRAIFKELRYGKEIVAGMLGADILGFQTDHDRRNFLNSAPKKLKSIVGTFPIGVDDEEISRLAQIKTHPLHQQITAKHLIISVDRVDYTKGIQNRLQAYATLLKKHPEYHRDVIFVQVGVPSRTAILQYRKQQKLVGELVKKINGRFGKPGWDPVIYINRAVPFSELVALYQIANIAMVTPIRDGMNLVAKEFVAAHKGRGGVLILSKGAGAADQLSEAILVNAKDIAELTQALMQAILMPKAEQVSRMRRLSKSVSEENVFDWAKRFLGGANRVQS